MRSKKSINVELILDLGRQPVSNRFLIKNFKGKIDKFPMRLMLNKSNGVLFLEPPFPVDAIKPRYDWLTCYEPENHLDDMVENIMSLPGITKKSIISGYSFKDDSTLERLKVKKYINQWRIDPKRDLSISDPFASVETLQSVFTVKMAKKIRERRGYADIIIVRHVVEHAYDLNEFISAISELIHSDGYIVWELPDCERALIDGDCTILREEHIHYFTSFTFRSTLESSGFHIVHSESVPYPLENSLVVITKKNKLNISDTQENETAVKREIKRAYQFAEKTTDRRNIIQAKFKYFKEKYGSIAIFGAGHLTVAFISIMELVDMIDFVIDDNPNKKGMVMPIGNIKILGSDALYKEGLKLCLLGLNPQNQSKVIENHYTFIENGGVFASIFPGTHSDLEGID